jgi:hypothetical protein
MNKHFKIENIVLTGTVDGDIELGEQLMLDHDITTNGGIVVSKVDNNVVVKYETLKKNIHKEDITPKIGYITSTDIKESFEKEVTLKEYHSVYPRSIKDDEYNLMDGYVRNLVVKSSGDENLHESLDRNELRVIDVTEDYKVIIHEYYFVNEYEDGSKTIDWGTERYALKYGIIYPYNSQEEGDTVDVDITGLSDILS